MKFYSYNSFIYSNIIESKKYEQEISSQQRNKNKKITENFLHFFARTDHDEDENIVDYQNQTCLILFMHGNYINVGC